ncbi:glutamine-hydrolyzing carbamoyl-phosphate synthase small subunit [bacterium]|nr:glutamine-hydrolyzing carbamoyl-phosphate synthase small subunit [bacterium]
MNKVILLLEDGKVFYGKSLVAGQECLGEVVFNTSMTGYQEVLTDPSYKGQIVTMTYPLIGNYGVNRVDEESKRPVVEGFIVRELCTYPSNFRSEESLYDYLKRNNIMLVTDMDTRAITLHIRSAGAMKGIMSASCSDIDKLREKLDGYPGIVGQDMVCKVTCEKKFEWKGDGIRTAEQDEYYEPLIKRNPKKEFKVAAFDFGIKYNMLRILDQLGCDVTVMPASVSIEDVEALTPDGVFLSNGPGDPEPVKYAVDAIRKLADKKYPIFGICLGHQLLGLALGAKTYKLKFGHRGANHPVKHLPTGKVEITCQNHGFAIDMDSFTDQDVELTHINLNDNTVEGFRHKKLPLFAVQYHPESSAGPHDSRHLFNRFVDMMRAHKK